MNHLEPTLKTIKPSIKRALNVIVRKYKKKEVIKLSSGITVVTEKYKNKTLIDCGGKVDPRFLKRF